MLRPRIEQPIPLVEGKPTLRRRRAVGPTAMLAGGFLGSAFLAFAVVAFVGAAFGVGLLPASVRIVAALLLCCAIVVLDLANLKGGGSCKLSVRRQTPKALEDKYGPYLGSMMWGIDTGLAVTTIRVSGTTWVAFGLTLLQLGPWWIGAAYAVGFCLPLATATLLLPWRPDHRYGEPMWIQNILFRMARLVQVGCALGLIGLGGILWMSA